jgi:membrane-bound metal-dependent hydrolase YbcI (DUF457 family)
MLNHSHALSGACAGTAAGIAMHLPVPSIAVLVGFAAGFATMPDMDKCHSGPARSLGPLSELVAWIIGKLCGGHRHFTHCLGGIAVFTFLAWLACHFRADLGGRIGLMLLLSLAFSAGLWALRIESGLAADALGAGLAALVTFKGWELALVPLACAIGWSVHIAGDMLTDSGCMLGYPAWKHRFHLLPEPLAFTTGTRPETLIVDPVLSVAFLVLASWAVVPGIDQAAWHAVAGAL